MDHRSEWGDSPPPPLADRIDHGRCRCDPQSELDPGPIASRCRRRRRRVVSAANRRIGAGHHVDPVDHRWWDLPTARRILSPYSWRHSLQRVVLLLPLLDSSVGPTEPAPPPAGLGWPRTSPGTLPYAPASRWDRGRPAPGRGRETAAATASRLGERGRERARGSAYAGPPRPPVLVARPPCVLSVVWPSFRRSLSSLCRSNSARSASWRRRFCSASSSGPGSRGRMPMRSIERGGARHERASGVEGVGVWKEGGGLVWSWVELAARFDADSDLNRQRVSAECTTERARPTPPALRQQASPVALCRSLSHLVSRLGCAPVDFEFELELEPLHSPIRCSRRHLRSPKSSSQAGEGAREQPGRGIEDEESGMRVYV